MRTGIELIMSERLDQLTKHGRTIANDVKYNTSGELVHAAVSLLLKDTKFVTSVGGRNLKPESWDTETWVKMAGKPYEERLVIAGALIAAEIDRLQNS